MDQKPVHSEGDHALREPPDSYTAKRRGSGIIVFARSLMRTDGPSVLQRPLFLPYITLIWLCASIFPNPSWAQAFFDSFDNLTGQLEETGTSDASLNPSYWLNSGGYVFQQFGLASTIQGRLPANDPWRIEYSESEYSDDTDEGYHPQSLFRLLHRRLWLNCRQQLYFRVIRDNLSTSKERDAWNGLLLMNRYLDSDNLYYAGLRVDGNAVFKKKQGGRYIEGVTITKRVFSGKYNRDTKPSLIPKFTWIGVRSDVFNGSDGSVTVILSLDIGRTGKWSRVITARDLVQDQVMRGPPLSSEGYVGIRTDFMDVEFDDYRIKPR